MFNVELMEQIQGPGCRERIAISSTWDWLVDRNFKTSERLWTCRIIQTVHDDVVDCLRGVDVEITHLCGVMASAVKFGQRRI